MKQKRDLKYYQSLPKIDLHLHIDGAIRPQTIFEMAEEKGLPLPAKTPEELVSYVRVSPDCRSLKEFLATFEVFYPLIRYEENLYRITKELCVDLKKDNVIYAEVRFAPALSLNDPNASTKEDLIRFIRAVLTALEENEREGGIPVRLILCCYRGLPLKTLYDTIDAWIDLKEGQWGKFLVGIDLAGDEGNYSTSLYREPFKKAISHRIPTTIHAGEAGGSSSVWIAVRSLGARRIGHGIHIRDDQKLKNWIKERRIALEICITSNLQTQTVPDIQSHPFRQFLDEELPVTINTDDPSISGITLSGEWHLAHETFGLTRAEEKRILHTAIFSAFCEGSLKTELLEKIQHFYEQTL